MYSVKSFSCYNMNGLSFVTFTIGTPIGERILFVDAPAKMNAETLSQCEVTALQLAAEQVLASFSQNQALVARAMVGDILSKSVVAERMAAAPVVVPVVEAPVVAAPVIAPVVAAPVIAPVVAPEAIAAIAAAKEVVASAARKPGRQPATKKPELIAAPVPSVEPVVEVPAVVLEVESTVEEFDPLADAPVEVTYLPYGRGHKDMQKALMAVLGAALPVGWSSVGPTVDKVRAAQLKIEAAAVPCLGSDGTIHPEFSATINTYLVGIK